MKRSLFVFIVFIVSAAISYAQDGERLFRKFKGEISFGYARFSKDNDIKNGFAIALEPKFMILDQLAIGGRLESVLLGRNIHTSNGYSDDENFRIKAYQSLIAIAEFYFTKDYSVRPFAGGGGGLYTLIASSTDVGTSGTYNDENRKRKFKAGGMLRAGVEIRHFRIGFEYNFIPNTSSTYYNSSGFLVRETSKNAYFSAKLGFCFGGGPYKKGKSRNND